jgi:hypothetical protein
MVAMNFTAQPQFSDPFEYLKAVDNFNPTEESIIAYLRALHAQALVQGAQCIPVEQFYTTGMLQSWYQAIHKFPELISKDAQVAGNLHMRTLLFNALTPQRCPITGKYIITLQDRINRSVELYLNQKLTNPKQDKKRELNREAVARHRARVRDDGSPESIHARVVKQAYDDYLLACKQRREAEQQWAEYIAQKKSAWETLRNKKPTQ